MKVTVDSLAGLPLCFMGEFAEDSRWSRVEEHESNTERGSGRPHRESTRDAPWTGMHSMQACGACPGFWSDYLDRHGDAELVPVTD